MFYFCFVANELVLNLSIPSLFSSSIYSSSKTEATELECVKSGETHVHTSTHTHICTHKHIYSYNSCSFTNEGSTFCDLITF